MGVEDVEDVDNVDNVDNVDMKTAHATQHDTPRGLKGRPSRLFSYYTTVELSNMHGCSRAVEVESTLLGRLQTTLNKVIFSLSHR